MGLSQNGVLRRAAKSPSFLMWKTMGIDEAPRDFFLLSPSDERSPGERLRTVMTVLKAEPNEHLCLMVYQGVFVIQCAS